jgi:hypothetical protein
MLKEFKVYYGGTPATQEKLDAIEEIVVDQEIGRAWEARIKIPIQISEAGAWAAEDDPAYAQYARVRIEARIGEGDLVPLIDGRIVDQDPGLSSDPGTSMLTLTVHDDTTLLHRVAGSESFPPGKSDSDIAHSLLSAARLGGAVKADPTGAPTDPDAVVQRHGTPMQLLRALMARHRDFYAYVLPGASAGTSDCFFKKLPETVDPALPDLVLTGRDRNISGFNIQRMANRATRYEIASLSMDDKTLSDSTSDPSAVAPAEGEAATSTDEANIRIRRPPPGMGDHTAPSEVAQGAALKSSYTVRAEGSVLPQCYGAILSPYRRLRARVSNSRYSTTYVIFKVTHTLGLSEYTQSFSVRTNSVSPASPLSASIPSPSAAIAAAFNVQVDIF